MENQEQKPEPATPETPITPEQPTKKAKPRWIVPVIVIAGIIVLGIGVWAGYNYWLKPAPPEEQSSEQEQQQEKPDEFADWETYRNEEYGFEFKYPNDWYIKNINLTVPRVNSNIMLCNKIESLVPGPGGSEVIPYCIEMWIKRNINQLSLRDWIKQEFSQCPECLSEERPIDMGGTSGLVFKESGMTNYKSIYVAKGSFVYKVSTVSNTIYMDVFNQILFIFKFIEFELDGKIIQDFRQNFYLKNLPNLVCLETLADAIVSIEGLSFYGGHRINGQVYEVDEEEAIRAEVSSNQYNIVNGCLYRNNDRVFEYNLLVYDFAGFFDEKTSLGEWAEEWFRFTENQNLYIFLKGAAGCGGCVFNGPYLVVDLESETIEMKYADLPYLPKLILSPSKKLAIEVDWADYLSEDNLIKLYLYDFLTTQRTNLVYELPDDKTILIQGHGVYVIKDAISWLNNSTIQIQLFEKDEPHPESGEPFTIDITK